MVLFPKKSYAILLTLLLAGQAVGFHLLSRRAENVPVIPPLKEFPARFGAWSMAQEYPIDPEVLAVLRADDTLNRLYVEDGTGKGANIYVAFFKSQRSGVMPHSPKNCLPGSGWVPMTVDRITLQVPSRAEAIEANRYVVQRGDNKTVVVYWYQSHNRAVASEYAARFYLALDALRYNRTDTALVRAMVPFDRNDDASATATVSRFIQAFYAPLQQILPY